ncbi:hypothetical protein QTP88_025172 [Uroleucon formosanum]
MPVLKENSLQEIVWYSFTKAFNIPSGNCPIPMGTYSTSSDYDTALLENNNFSTVYFYGKYKYVAKWIQQILENEGDLISDESSSTSTSIPDWWSLLGREANVGRLARRVRKSK